MSANQASLLFCSVALLAVIVMLFTQRAYRRELRTLRAVCVAQDKLVVHYRWREWWQRNAAQTPPCDRGRYYLCQLAYASVLAPSTDVFLRDCRRLADDTRLPRFARLAANDFPSEVQAPKLPWVQWDEDNPGVPPHTPGQLQALYERVVREIEQHGLLEQRILSDELASASAQPRESAGAKLA